MLGSRLASACAAEPQTHSPAPLPRSFATAASFQGFLLRIATCDIWSPSLDSTSALGVPALFRWLSQKYPKIVSKVIEENPDEVDGVKIPIDTRGPNPNGEEFDNLYLDMNGIVHPCSHPEDGPPPATETEMMLAVFEYTDRVLNMVRPRKLLMIAVDGVAPRAKLNQQRSRRFRAVQEAQKKDEDKAELLKMLRAQGQEPEGGDEAPKKTWDSNAITPGTPFMNLLAQSLRYWVAYKLNSDPAWKNLKVIISDASVPGEGEHKIMSFIRSQRSCPTHDPNTRHVMYGLDADLIMLGLATHEPYFRILREDVFANDTKPGVCRLCNQPGHMAAQCKGVPAKKSEFGEKGGQPLKPFIWLHVGVLREYLAIEMAIPGMESSFDLERAIDDWIFMCFFVGNDFLPHLPSLDIREQGIDTLINIWRDNFPSMGGYVTKDGHVDLARAQVILEGLARQEDGIFQKRREIDQKKEAAAKRRKLNERRSQGNMREDSSFMGENGGTAARYMGTKKRGEMIPDVNALPTFAPGAAQTRSDPRYVSHDEMVNKANTANKSAAQVLKESLAKKKEETASQSQKGAVEELMSSLQPAEPAQALGKRTADMMEDDSSTPGRATPVSQDESQKPRQAQNDSDAPPEDSVRLWEDGYADRYYEQKFHKSPSDIEFRQQVGRDYVIGLVWVLHYYFQGPASWTWYYPHHYAPFAADFTNLDKLDVKFDKGKPVRPYEQLMSVMPAASNHTIPSAFHELMTSPNSDIVDFYPEEFEVDLNGKKFAWQGVAILPFIDGERLMAAMNTKYHLITEDERIRNEHGRDVLIFNTQHKLYDDIATNFYSKKAKTDKLALNPAHSGGLTGKVEKNPDYLPASSLVYPLEGDEMPSLDEDNTISVTYDMPPVHATHKSVLLPGLTVPPPVLDGEDIAVTRRRTQKGFRNDFRNDGGRPRNDPGRTYYNDNRNNGGGPRGQPNFANNFPPPPGWQGPPPPMPQRGGYPPQGYAPPPPPGWQQQGGYQQGYNGQGQGYQNGHQGQGYQNGHQGQNGNRGYNGGQNYDSRNNGYGNGYNGGGGGGRRH